jgi:uncharacterized protein YkwD
MGSRHVKAVLGAVIVAGAIVFSSSLVQQERAWAATAVQSCDGGSITLNAKEKRVLVLHNQARKDLGLRPLCVDLKLTRAARSHSREMIKGDYFSHSSYDGESVGERLKRFGYDLIIHGENLAGGTAAFGEPDSAFQRWMNSQGHRATVLDSRFRPVGVGTYTGDYKGFQEYTMYTVDFGVRR